MTYKHAAIYIRIAFCPFYLNIVGQFEGCGHLDKSDVKLLVIPGVVGVDEHLADQPHLLVDVGQVDVVLTGHHVKLEDGEAVQAVRGRQHPVLVYNAASAKVGNAAEKVAQRNLSENFHIQQSIR